MGQDLPKNFDDTSSITTPDYATLNMPGLINAAGTLTSLGGCRTRPEAISAMRTAADHFIPSEALQEKTGECVAQLLRVSAALVTAGAAPGLTLASAACMVRDVVRQQPDCLRHPKSIKLSSNPVTVILSSAPC